MRSELKALIVDPYLKESQNSMPSSCFTDMLNFENMNDLSYFQMCFNESLRIQPPVTYSSMCMMTEDVQMGKYKLRKNDLFVIDMHHLHRNRDQWIEPEKYIPERFDSKSEYYLTPSGKKRHPMAFGPFLGGKRICLGKSFAEIVSKVVGPSFLGSFNFEFVDGKGKPDVSLIQIEEAVVEVKVTNHTW